jgi:hypothetical protein
VASAHRNDKLDLLSAPASIRIPHVGRRLNRRHEFHSSVSDAGEDDQRANNVAESSVLQNQAAHEDVDCIILSVFAAIVCAGRWVSERGRLTDATAEEREHEAGVLRQVGRHLGQELEPDVCWFLVRVDASLDVQGSLPRPKRMR